MTSQTSVYPIGTPGTPWGDVERRAWLDRQIKHRSYADDVLTALADIGRHAPIVDYGQVAYGDEQFALRAIRSTDWRDHLPCALITGGVHGYETSGVHGALAFARAHLTDYAGRLNVLIAPCVSPWAYERIHRWNAHAIDPNRSFRAGGEAQEALALMRLIAPWFGRFMVHIDLHETTDSDESEFRPALAARDGKPYEPGEIPDGFYLVDDQDNPQPQFQQAIIDAVSKVTHIAPADAAGNLIGTPLVAPGVIRYPFKALGLCAGASDARFTTTTEVYPDSARTTPAECVAAQVAAVRAGLDYVLA